MKTVIQLTLALVISGHILAQKANDSLTARYLDSVTVVSYLREPTIKRIDAIQGTFNFTGKKTESIDLAGTDADITNKTGRQAFAKVPGIFVYDMDGAGNQINIAARGLDPHRGWDFNIRKDGIITNSDMYGYPASHFSMPLESVERINLNNLTDKQYFTKRPTFYPGPGVWPSEGRNMNASFILKF